MVSLVVLTLSIESPNSCILPEDSVRIFKTYGLETVSFESLGVYEDFSQLKDSLKETYIKISQSTISTDEEGSVIYFVRRRVEESQEPDRILSLGKLKTLEYRLYRKLREKVRGTSSRMINKNMKARDMRDAWKTVMKKFRSESKDLARGIGGDEPLLSEDELEFYFKVAQKAVDILGSDEEKMEYIQNNYLSFLKEILEGRLCVYIKNIEMEEVDSERLVSRLFEIQEEINYSKPEI